MKNIVITGTSSGVGFESAIRFAQNGFKVWATMRNLAKADPLRKAQQEQNLNLQILQLDVTKWDSIQTAIDEVIDQDGRIDVLLNNAGAGFARPVEQADFDQIQWVTNVNYLGVVAMTKAVLPHMRVAKSGHVINVTSVGGLVGQPFNELYCGAKFAVEGFTESLASYVTPSFNVHFSTIEPGGIATEFMKSATKATANENNELASGEYAPIFQKYVSRAQSRSSDGDSSPFQTALEVANVILKVAQAEVPPLRTRTSDWAEELCKLKTNADPDGTLLVKQVVEQFL